MLSAIRLSCKFSYDNLTQLLNPRISGQPISDKLTIESIALSGDAEWLYANARMSGAYNGFVRIRYKLGYHPEDRRFVLNDLQMELTEGGLLVKGANWIMRKFFAQKMDQQFEQLMNEKFDGLLNDLLAKYGNHTLDNGMVVNAELQEVTFEDIRWDHDALWCTAIAQGTFRLTL